MHVGRSRMIIVVVDPRILTYKAGAEGVVLIVSCTAGARGGYYCSSVGWLVGGFRCTCRFLRVFTLDASPLVVRCVLDRDFFFFFL